MTFGDFIKDELSSILLQILCAIILTIYLCSLSLDIGECVLILIAWIVIASLYYFYKYYRTNLIFKKWSSILQSLERKYLLGEMISNYGSFQLELFIQILRSSLKSMTQEVSKVQIEKKEYANYICIFLLFYHSPVGFSTSNNCRVSKQKLFCQFIIPS